jgi:5S rRNA maturation endonuclease (ribonuclease M5)
MSTIEDFLTQLFHVKKSVNGWQACCPAHQDAKASLSVSTGEDGRILLHCFAGCSSESIVAQLGLKMADLFPDASRTNLAPSRKIATTYDYTDADGKLLFQCVRYEPKDFRQRRPDPAKPGEWIWNLDGVHRLLYRLRELKSAIAAGTIIYTAEGEKDVDALVNRGFAATCNPMGAGKWRPEHTEALRGAAGVIVMADKDEPGRKHARAVATALLGVAKRVKLIELPDVNGIAVKDAADYFNAGGSADGLRAIVDSVLEFVPSSEPQPFTSVHVAGQYIGADGDGTDEEGPMLTAPIWPEPIAQAAFHGLAGDVVGLIDQHTEADRAAVLSMFLAAFGNMAGPNAHFMAEACPHPARVWPVLVGETAKGRKGSAWSSLRYLLERLDEQWLARCITSGLSSGEGLIWAVRDPIVRQKKNKEGIIEPYEEDEGVADKRLLTVEEEFSAVLKVAAREGNTVSDLLRRAWDRGDLRTMTKNSPARATGAHVTVIGHITKPDLARLLSETDALNGFGNRFLWLAVRRSKLLPEGGALHAENLTKLTLRLRQALDFARKTALMERSAAARELWRERYPVLTADQPGLSGALTNRAEAQVMRLALIYALLDCSPQIDMAHLQAALAFWDFCHRSTWFIFGESLGDRVVDRILDELRCAGPRGRTRNELREVFKHNLPAAKIEAALALLHRLRLAQWSKEPCPKGGRPATLWRSTPYAKNAINAKSPPPVGVSAYFAYSALGVQQPETPPNSPSSDIQDLNDARVQPSHNKNHLVEEFA